MRMIGEVLAGVFADLGIDGMDRPGGAMLNTRTPAATWPGEVHARMETERKGPTGVTLPAKSSGHTFGDVGGGSPVYATGAAKQRPEAVWRGISASLFTANRNKVTGAPPRSPRGPVALFLVVDNSSAHAALANSP